MFWDITYISLLNTKLNQADCYLKQKKPLFTIWVQLLGAGEESWLLLQRTQVPHRAGSRPPLTPSPGDLVLSSGLHRLLYTSFPSHPPPIKNIKSKKSKVQLFFHGSMNRKPKTWYSCDSTLAEKILHMSLSLWGRIMFLTQVKLARFLWDMDCGCKGTTFPNGA